MNPVNLWKALSPSGKVGLSLGTLLILAGLVAGGAWLLTSDFEPVVHGSSAAKVALAVREIERMKVPYRVLPDGTTVEVPRKEVGRVRVALASAGADVSTTGFELFNNSDFSTTEFTQRINYQRALQGELARTIGNIDGVASTRVHIVLPESGFLRRKSVSPTAAVNVIMNPGSQLTAAQVLGIQKLVGASVPEIKLDDVTVIDQDGIALTKVGGGAQADKGQLAVKREVDTYLEGKVRRMLVAMDPQGDFAVSVDAVLNASDSKVTLDDVIPTDGQGKGNGVVVRERQSQRQDGAAAPDAAASGALAGAGSVSREVEYKIGRRVEETATPAGAIEHISVAVLARSGRLQANEALLKGVIANAVGANEDKGDTVALVLLPPLAGGEAASDTATAHEAVVASGPVAPRSNQVALPRPQPVVPALLGLLLAVLIGGVWWAWSRQGKAAETTALTDAEVDAIVNRIHVWMQDEAAHASR